MTERLIVKNFLCLKDIDIEIKDFLILIGPQAAGKSLCAKLLYYFRTITEEITLYSLENALGKSSDFDKLLTDKFESFFPKEHWGKQNFCIEYQYDQKTCFSIKKEKGQEINLYLDQAFYAVASEVPPSFQDIAKPGDDPERIEKVLKILSDKRTDILMAKNIFIPAGRSFFSLLQKNIFRFLRTNNNVDTFLLEFGDFYEQSKQIKCNIPEEAQSLIHSIGNL